MLSDLSQTQKTTYYIGQSIWYSIKDKTWERNLRSVLSGTGGGRGDLLHRTQGNFSGFGNILYLFYDDG